MMRNPIRLLCGVVILTGSACSKEAPPPRPRHRGPGDHADPARRAGRRWSWSARPPAPRTSRSAPASRASSRRWLHRRLAGQEGPAALPDRPQAAPGRARQREGEPRDGAGAAREGSQRRQAPQAAGQAAGRQPAGTRQRRSPRRTRRPRRSTPTRRRSRRREFDLGYTTITSPIDGLVGTTKVKAGNLVGRGESTLLVTISLIDPILFRAGIAEAEYLQGRPAAAGASRRSGRPAARRCPSS